MIQLMYYQSLLMPSKQRIHKIKTDYGMGDFYMYHRKKYKSSISKSKFNSIITEYNKAIQKAVIEDNLIYLMPGLRYELFLEKSKKKARIDDNGKVDVSSLPVNYKATKALWARDAEAKERKLLIRHTNKHTQGYVFRIGFTKIRSIWKHKMLVRFKPTREFSRKLGAALLDQEKVVDAFLRFASADSNN